MAQPGDVVTVHEGVYRELVNPPRGGESDAKRIIYQAAPGEKVAIKGSEVVKGWEKVQNDTWKAVVPNRLFGSFNPYQELIRGDWFNPKGREHHRGAVYLNGDWLIEATKLDEVMAPAGTAPAWLNKAGGEYLLNVAWLQPANMARVAANSFTAKHGTQNAPCSEGGECVGFILHGHWVKYEKVDFGQNANQLEIRAASASRGGVIEVRLDAPDGELIGSCSVPNTGDWQSWESFKVGIKPVSGVRTLCLVFRGSSFAPAAEETLLWYAKVDADNTTIWAQFKGVDPNEQLVEINVRRAVFYPSQTNRDFITVRGFTLCQAATQWAPPTSEQIAIIGTNWSKGWIIENNTISHSVCSGIALGKHGDEYDNTSADTAEGYVKTIERAVARGWNKDTIGGHLVRNNHIAFCEQTGIVGSMGCSFSTVTGNTIHDIHLRQLFTGAEMAGIKFHGAIDVEIRGNHIYRTCLGTWLDWMAQGARVTGNLYHDNQSFDLFVEVDHGPFLVDNNLFLSPTMVLSVSQGGAYVHNLALGGLNIHEYDGRLTPYHKAHSTELAGMHDNPRGDDKYYNNLFIERANFRNYNKVKMPVFMAGNVFLKGAKPCEQEKDALQKPEFDPEIRLVEKADGIYLDGNFDASWAKERTRRLVTTELLGKAVIPDLPYENRDGSPLKVSTDYFGKNRNEVNPFPGPFEISESGKQSLKVWPVGEGK
ncbi:MAG: carbohydrate-binding protein [Pirellulaceae bacterium]|nr:carbohydrate-binding protein [Pirellulaceae bacterium]